MPDMVWLVEVIDADSTTLMVMRTQTSYKPHILGLLSAYATNLKESNKTKNEVIGRGYIHLFKGNRPNTDKWVNVTIQAIVQYTDTIDIIHNENFL